MYIAQIVIIYTIIHMHENYISYKHISKTKYRLHEMQNLEVKINNKNYWL